VERRGYEAGGASVVLDSDAAYDALHRGTRFYTSTEALLVPPARRGAFRTDVRVVEADCLDVGRRLAHAGEDPLVLNMANRRNPGGGVLGGAGAQEENLFRRSNLLWSLYQFAPYASRYGVPPSPKGHRYPIPRESGGIYSPGALVFRSSEATGYAFLPTPYRVAFATVPAIPNPDVVARDGRQWLTEAVADATRRKIRAILRIGAHHGHTSLVLSAFGCGAFRNPAHHVAALFREVLREPEFAGVFGGVVFAVLNDHNAVHPGSPEGNLAAFSRAFA
jgi:uncharacterized protein (TIGR02452 family)